MSEIVFKFVADTSGFAAGINVADAAQKKLGAEVDNFGRDSKKAYDDAAKGAGAFGKETENTTIKTKSLKSQLKDLKAELANASDPKEIERLAKAAGALADQIGDASDAAAVFATDSPFEAVGNAIGSVGSKLLSLDFKGASEQSKLLVSATKQITMKEAVTGVKQLGSTFLNIGKSLLLNPIFLIGTILTLIISNFDKLTNAGGIVGKVFRSIGEAISTVIDLGKDFLDFIGLIDSTKKSFEDLAKANENLTANIGARYDYEIAKAKAAGKEVEKLEIEKAKAVLNGVGEQLRLTREAYKTREIDQTEFANKIQEIGLSANKANIDLINAQSASEKKALDQSKKSNDDYKKSKEDLQKALEDLAKRSSSANLDGLNGQEKLIRQKQLAEQEVEELRKQIEAKGKLTNRNFKFNAEQESEFANLKEKINREYYSALLQLSIDYSTKQANESKKLIDNDLANLELRNEIAKNNIEKTRALEGAGEPEKLIFEQEKNRKLLELDLQFQKQKLDITLKEIDAEQNVKSVGLIAELNALQGKEDAISKLRSESIGKELDAISLNSELSKQAAISATDNIISEINDKLTKAPTSKLDIKKLLNLDDSEIALFLNVKFKTKVDPSEIAATKNALSQLASSLKEISNIYFAEEQKKLDKELDDNKKIIETRDKNISSLKESLKAEDVLKEQGLANNIERIDVAIEAQERARQKDLDNEKRIKDEKKKLAKEQLLIDSITQGSQMTLAIAQLYGALSGFVIGPVPVGLIVATASSIAMLAAFAAQKSQALNAINEGKNLWTGGYTGDGDKYEARGTVHAGEYVINKEKTKRNFTLLDGIHNDDNRKIELGLSELLKNTGISLSGLPNELNASQNIIKNAEMKAYFNNDNSGVEKRLMSLEGYLNTLVNQGNKFETILPNGDRIIQNGNVTTKIKSNV